MARGPRHFAFPMQFAGAGFATVEQDTVDDIAGCCAAVLAYPLGSRPERPDFGVDEQAFAAQGPNPAEIRHALAAWEPRANTTVDFADADLVRLFSRVRVQVGATDSQP